MEVVCAELTWTGASFERGVAVTVDKASGMIVDVSRDDERARKRGCAEELGQVVKVVELAGRALLPGFVNCHSHAFQRELRGLGETYEVGSVDSFWTWRQEMYKLVERIGTTDEFLDVTQRCFEEMRASGITTVGEFHYFHHSEAAASDSSGDKQEATAGSTSGRFDLDEVVIQAAKRAGVRLVLLSAMYAFGGFGSAPLGQAQRRFATPSLAEYWTQLDALLQRVAAEPLASVGVVAHSLRAVSLEQLEELHAGSRKRGVPFHLHIEEQPREVEDCKMALQKTPMRVLLDAAEISAATTAVHCNHTEPAELREFVARGGNVCICPLTEGNLGDGVMPDFSACAESVCLGTDCNARIDMLEELRWLEYSQRLVRLERGVCAKAASRGAAKSEAGPQLLRMATVNGARSLGLAAGKIEAGCVADFCVVDLAAPPLQVGGSAACGAGDLASRLASALVFGCGAREVVCATCVAGDWKEPRPRFGQ